MKKTAILLTVVFCVGAAAFAMPNTATQESTMKTKKVMNIKKMKSVKKTTAKTTAVKPAAIITNEAAPALIPAPVLRPMVPTTMSTQPAMVPVTESAPVAPATSAK
jgi:hypothetical protein